MEKTINMNEFLIRSGTRRGHELKEKSLEREVEDTVSKIPFKGELKTHTYLFIELSKLLSKSKQNFRQQEYFLPVMVFFQILCTEAYLFQEVKTPQEVISLLSDLFFKRFESFSSNKDPFSKDGEDYELDGNPDQPTSLKPTPLFLEIMSNLGFFPKARDSNQFTSEDNYDVTLSEVVSEGIPDILLTFTDTLEMTTGYLRVSSVFVETEQDPILSRWFQNRLESSSAGNIGKVKIKQVIDKLDPNKPAEAAKYLEILDRILPKQSFEELLKKDYLILEERTIQTLEDLEYYVTQEETLQAISQFATPQRTLEQISHHMKSIVQREEYEKNSLKNQNKSTAPIFQKTGEEEDY